MVEGPDGTIYNILRFNVLPAVLGNYAIALRYDLKSNTLTFDRVFGLPGGHSKFDIRRDNKTGVYLTMSSINTNIAYTDQRNILAFCASEDLFHWTVVDILLEVGTGKRSYGCAFPRFYFRTASYPFPHPLFRMTRGSQTMTALGTRASIMSPGSLTAPTVTTSSTPSVHLTGGTLPTCPDTSPHPFP